jgi:hypothetical protein
MRAAFVLGALASAFGSPAAAEPSIPYDLQAAVARYDRAQLDGDREKLGDSLADDYLLVNSTGVTETKGQLIADYTAPGYDLQTLTIEDPVERVWDDGAVIGGIGTLTGTEGGKHFEARLRFADIWAKRGGKWQVVYTQVSKAPSNITDPTVRIGDPKSLENVVHFGPPDPRLKSSKAGEIFWRVDVDLPPNVRVERIAMRGYAAANLHLTDGRCFQVAFIGRQPEMDEVTIAPDDCGADQRVASPDSRPPAAGWHHVGRAWDLDAWSSPNGSEAVLTRTHAPNLPPPLKADMRLLAVGGMGAPDAPLTEVTLAGVIGRQLTLATVMLFLP